METAIKIVKILNSEAYEGYVVGGAVRDRLMNIPHSDIDLATDARPEEVTKLFRAKGYKVIPTGFDHGTVTLIGDDLPAEGVELTTYRRDVSCDGRNATVEFADTILEDLSRRDFTMNAIAYDPIDEVYLDPFGGMKDIEKGIIRCVGDAGERFKEDHLRMLRALRFHSILGFKIDDQLEDAIDENAYLIENISAERIKMEIDKTFSKADKPSRLFYRTGVCLFHYILPELKKCIGFEQNKYHKYDVFIHTMVALDAVPKEYPLIRWAVLFHDLGKPASCENYGDPHASFHAHELISEKIAITTMKRLRFSGEDRTYISNLVKCHMFQASNKMKDGAIRRFMVKLGVEYIDDLIIMKFADRKGNPNKECGELTLDTNLKRRATKILEEDAAFKITDLAINGADVMAVLNIPAGPDIGKVLKALLEDVLDDPSLNTREYLLDRVGEGKDE